MKKFKNAENGVSKLFAAQILELIASVLLVIGFAFAVVMTAVQGADLSSGATLAAKGIIGITAIVSIFAAFVLFIVGFIINIVGVSQASKDDEAFRIALYGVIAGIVFAILGSIFVNISPMVSNLMQTLGTVADIFVLIYVIQGVRNLAVKLGNTQMDVKGDKLLKLILAVIILELIANIIATIYSGSVNQVALSVGMTISGVFAITAAVLQVVEYIMYLSYLAKAKKMLA